MHPVEIISNRLTGTFSARKTQVQAKSTQLALRRQSGRRSAPIPSVRHRGRQPLADGVVRRLQPHPDDSLAQTALVVLVLGYGSTPDLGEVDDAFCNAVEPTPPVE